MDLSEKKQIARRYMEEFWGECQPDLAEKFLKPGFLFHSPLKDLEGIDAIKQFVSTINSVFSNIKFNIFDVIAEDEKVAIRWQLNGQHSAEVMGVAPSGRQVKLPGVGFRNK